MNSFKQIKVDSQNLGSVEQERVELVEGESGWGGGRHRLNEFDDQNYHGFTITRHDYHENNMG